MDDEKELIFIAISNSILLYRNQLEEVKTKEEKDLLVYMINRYEEIIDKLTQELSDIPDTIPRPKF